MQAFKAEFATDGTDWDFIPYDTMIYGGGGIGGWASLCGVPNGCVHLLNLIGLHGALGSDVMGHYCTSEYPQSDIGDLYDDPYYGHGGTGGYTWVKHPIPDNQVLAHTTSYNPLCHVSISKFCYEAGINLVDAGPYSYAHKADRCGKIVGDLAATTAELINHYALHGNSADPYALPAQTAQCLSCHNTTSDAPLYPATTGKMDCVECHTYGTVMSGSQLMLIDVWTEGWDGSAYVAQTDFSPGDWIHFKVRFAVLGNGSAYVKTVQSKVVIKRTGANYKFKLEEDGTYSASETTWELYDSPAKVPADATTGEQGKVMVRMKLFDYEGGTLMNEVAKTVKFNIV
jgi:hypothetical protein